MDFPQKMIVIIADGAPLQSLKVDSSITLQDLRKKVNANHYITNRLTYSLLYIHDGSLIDSGKEPQMKLNDILLANQYEVHLNSKLDSINVILNQNDKHTKSVPLAFSLSSLRNLDPKMFPLHLNFFKKDKIIRLGDESRVKIQDILVNNTIHIRQADVNKHETFEAEQEDNQKQEVNQKQEESKKANDKGKGKGRGKKEEKQKVETLKFKVLIDRQKTINSEFDVTQPLRALREATKEIVDSMDFSWKNGLIYEGDEMEIKISDILDEAIQSAYTIINKQTKSQQNLKDTVNVNWVPSKAELMCSKQPEVGFKQNESLNQYLNLSSIEINEIPKGVIIDPDGNPADSKYDLGIDGAFKGFKILIGAFTYNYDLDNKTVCFALQGKGFEITIVKTEIEFIKIIENFDQIWILSYRQWQSDVDKVQFMNAIKKHLAQKKGMLLWADNDPFYVHSNFILDNLNIGGKIQLVGNDYGTKIMSRTNQKGAIQQSFISHQITTGMFKVNEGITICYPQNTQKPNSEIYGDLKIIGRGSAGRPSYMVLEGNEERGRIVVDCAFTKLYQQWWNGNWRYVRNCAVWLLWLEHRLGLE